MFSKTILINQLIDELINQIIYLTQHWNNLKKMCIQVWKGADT